jgi:hypothetical protein
MMSGLSASLVRSVLRKTRSFDKYGGAAKALLVNPLTTGRTRMSSFDFMYPVGVGVDVDVGDGSGAASSGTEDVQNLILAEQWSVKPRLITTGSAWLSVGSRCTTYRLLNNKKQR